MGLMPAAQDRGDEIRREEGESRDAGHVGRNDLLKGRGLFDGGAIFEQAASNAMRAGEQADEREASGRRLGLAGKNQAQLLATLLQSNGGGKPDDRLVVELLIVMRADWALRVLAPKAEKTRTRVPPDWAVPGRFGSRA